MLVQCRCGKKLNVKEGLIGKRIRCPACAEAFVAEGGDDEGIMVNDRRGRGRTGSADSAPKRKKTPAPSDDDFDDDGEDRPSSTRRRTQDISKKPKTSMTRNIVGIVALGVLVVVAAFLYWKKFSGAATLELESTLSSVDVFVDDREIEHSAPKLSNLKLKIDLSPGTHTVRIAKEKFHPFTKQINLKNGQTEVLRVDLKRIVAGDAGPGLKDFEGTWVLTFSNKTLRVYTVANDGKVIWEQKQSRHQLSDKGLDIVMVDGFDMERWQLKNGKLFIERFKPGGYPDGKPSEAAVGEKETPQELAEDTKVLQAFEGKWKITYANNTKGNFTADASGRLSGRRRLVRIRGHVLLDYGGRLDRLTLEGNQLKVEHYNPSSKYLEDPDHPQVTGTAVREAGP